MSPCSRQKWVASLNLCCVGAWMSLKDFQFHVILPRNTFENPYFMFFFWRPVHRVRCECAISATTYWWIQVTLIWLLLFNNRRKLVRCHEIYTQNCLKFILIHNHAKKLWTDGLMPEVVFELPFSQVVLKLPESKIYGRIRWNIWNCSLIITQCELEAADNIVE